MTAPSFLKPSTRPANDDRLIAIRNKAREAAQTELQVKNLEESLSEAKRTLQEYYTKTLPDMMDEAQISSLSLDAKGNMPAFDITVGPYYKASIPEAWGDEQKEAAFKYLEQHKAGDLIKHIIIIEFDIDDHVKAKKLATELRKRKFDVSVKKTVHWGTLTSWLKYQVEKVKRVPDLSVINATVGRVAKLKEIKR